MKNKATKLTAAGVLLTTALTLGSMGKTEFQKHEIAGQMPEGKKYEQLDTAVKATPAWNTREYTKKPDGEGKAGELTRQLDEFFAAAPQNTLTQKEVSDAFKQIFVGAFANDKVAKGLPFNAEYLDQLVFPLTEYYFHNHFGGRATNSHIRSFAGADTSIHETLHVLGLSEALTELLCAEFMGKEDPTKRATPNDWEYNPQFVKALLDRCPDKAEFWRAAFTSNEEFGKLWDKYMPITYEEYGKTKSINVRMNALGEAYSDGHKEFGKLIREFEDEIYESTGLYDFERSFNNVPAALFGDDAQAREKAKEFFKKMSDFSSTHGIPANGEVLDSHITLMQKKAAAAAYTGIANVQDAIWGERAGVEKPLQEAWNNENKNAAAEITALATDAGAAVAKVDKGKTQTKGAGVLFLTSMLGLMGAHLLNKRKSSPEQGQEK